MVRLRGFEPLTYGLEVLKVHFTEIYGLANIVDIKPIITVFKISALWRLYAFTQTFGTSRHQFFFHFYLKYTNIAWDSCQINN